MATGSLLPKARKLCWVSMFTTTGQTTMPPYYFGLAMVICAATIIYSIFWSCMSERQSNPPLPRRSIVGLKQQPNAGDIEANEERPDGPSSPDIAATVKGNSKVPTNERGNQAQNHDDAASSIGGPNTAEKVIAGTTILALLAVLYQGYVMNQQITIDNRAWLTIDEPTIEKPVSINYALKGKFKTRNLGKTPARIVSYFLRSSSMKSFRGFPTHYDMPTYLSGVNIPVAPNGMKDFVVYDPRFKLTEEEFDGLKDHEIIMVQFVLTYLDAFDKLRFTVNTYIYDPRMEALSEMTLGPAEMN